MIVEKIFSNIEEPEESLYSVLMTEEELRMYANLASKVMNGTQAVKRAVKASGGFNLAPKGTAYNNIITGRGGLNLRGTGSGADLVAQGRRILQQDTQNAMLSGSGINQRINRRALGIR